MLALPQLPLTLGNALMAIREENNRCAYRRCADHPGFDPAVPRGLLQRPLFGLFTHPIPGVILFLMGAQLALGSCDFSKNQGRTRISTPFLTLRSYPP